MNEQVPAPLAPAEPTAEQLAQNKLVQVMMNDRFVNLLRITALYEQSVQTVKKIETDQDRESVVAIFDGVKKALKEAEAYRLYLVGPYKKFTKLIDDQFRVVKGQLTGVKDHFGAIIVNDQKQREAEHQAAVAEVQAKAAEDGPVEKEVEDGVVVVQTQVEIPAPPDTTIKTDSGASASVRTYESIEVKDPVKLLKAIISTSERNTPFTLDLIEFKKGEIKKLQKDLGRKKIPGVVLHTKDKAV